MKLEYGQAVPYPGDPWFLKEQPLDGKPPTDRVRELYMPYLAWQLWRGPIQTRGYFAAQTEGGQKRRLGQKQRVLVALAKADDFTTADAANVIGPVTHDVVTARTIMRRLLAHGLVEYVSQGSGRGKLSRWRITEEGRRHVAAIAQEEGVSLHD